MVTATDRTTRERPLTNTPGHSAYPGYGESAGAYGWDSSRAGVPKTRVDRLSQSLWAAVAVLGSATFAVSLGSPVVLGFPVRLSVLAAVVAAVSLLPGQAGRGWIVVALAVTGFLDALDTWIRAGNPGWALTAIMVLNALQSLAAVGALLHAARVFRSVESGGAQDYSAYMRLSQAYQAYAAQYQQPASAQYDAGRGTDQVHTEASARADAAQESFAALQARYAEHGVGAPARQSRGSTGAPSVLPVADPGIAGTNRAVPKSHADRAHQQNPGAGTVEPSGP
jgi:hypothetical protein